MAKKVTTNQSDSVDYKSLSSDFVRKYGKRNPWLTEPDQKFYREASKADPAYSRMAPRFINENGERQELTSEKSFEEHAVYGRTDLLDYYNDEGYGNELNPEAIDQQAMPEDINNYPGEGLPPFANGGNVAGYLKENALNIAKVAGGIGLSFINPALGIPLALDGGMDMINNDDEISDVYSPPTSATKQTYLPPMAYGGKVGRTDYEGLSHKEGGIQIPITGEQGEQQGFEAEADEVRTGDTVHSTQLKLTKAMYNRYKDSVDLKRSDIGDSIADIITRIDKPFEKRNKGDLWNDDARRATQVPGEDMSDELAEIMGIAEDMHQGMMEDEMALNAEEAYTKAAWGGDIKDFLTDPGNAPVSANLMMGVGEALTPVEEVDYEQAKFTPTNFTPTSTKGGINQIRQTFGNVTQQARRLNPRGLMNNLSSFAAQEAEAVGNFTEKTNALNASGQNRAYALDSSNMNRMEMYNTQLAAKEAEANAANRGAKRTAIGAHFAAAATQTGRIARDEKLFDANERFNQRYLDLEEEKIDAFGFNGNPEISISPEGENTFDLNNTFGDINPDEAFMQGDQEEYAMGVNPNPQAEFSTGNPLSILSAKGVNAGSTFDYLTNQFKMNNGPLNYNNIYGR